MNEPNQPAAPASITINERAPREANTVLPWVVLAMMTVVGLVALRPVSAERVAMDSPSLLSMPSSTSHYVDEWPLTPIVGPYLGNPVAEPDQWEVDCLATGSGTNLLVDTAGVTHTTSTLLVVNSSATCVQIGGGTLTSTTGAPVGTGATCYLGAWMSLDTKGGKCLSTSGTVTVDVIGGKL